MNTKRILCLVALAFCCAPAVEASRTCDGGLTGSGKLCGGGLLPRSSMPARGLPRHTPTIREEPLIKEQPSPDTNKKRIRPIARSENS